MQGKTLVWTIIFVLAALYLALRASTGLGRRWLAILSPCGPCAGTLLEN